MAIKSIKIVPKVLKVMEVKSITGYNTLNQPITKVHDVYIPQNPIPNLMFNGKPFFNAIVKTTKKVGATTVGNCIHGKQQATLLVNINEEQIANSRLATSQEIEQYTEITNRLYLDAMVTGKIHAYDNAWYLDKSLHNSDILSKNRILFYDKNSESDPIISKVSKTVNQDFTKIVKELPIETKDKDLLLQSKQEKITITGIHNKSSITEYVLFQQYKLPEHTQALYKSLNNLPPLEFKPFDFS